MKKKILLFMMSICMLLPNETVTVIHAEKQEQIEAVLTENSTDKSKELSGNYGTNLTWKIDIASGELQLDGSGKMENITGVNEKGRKTSPWWEYKDKITSIKISDTITNISEYAFSELSNLKSVQMGKGIETLGAKAFYACENLESIELPEGLKEIDSETFFNCISLKKLDIPKSVESFGLDVFYNCKSLEEIVIPDNVEYSMPAFKYCENLKKVTIGKNIKNIYRTFEHCYNIETIKVSSKNKCYTVQDGILYDKKKTEILYIGKVKNGSCYIPSTVTTIEAGALNKNVKKITVSSKNKRFSSKDGVLFDKKKTTLLRCPVGMKGSYEVPSGVKTITKEAFASCNQLKSITIGQDVSTLEHGAISDCAKLEQIELGNKVSLYTHKVDPYEEQDGYGIENCPKLKSIKVLSDNSEYSSVDGVLFNKNKTELICYPEGHGTSYIIPKTVKKIGELAFCKCQSLEELEVANSAIEVEEDAFYECKGIKTLKIGTQKIDVGEIVKGCPNLENIIMPEENKYYDVAGGIVYNKSHSKLFAFLKKPEGDYVVPKMVTYIDENAFYNCEKLRSLKLPQYIKKVNLNLRKCYSLKKIEIGKKVKEFKYVYADGYYDIDEWVKEENIEEIIVSEENQKYASIDGILYDKEKKILYRCGKGRKGKVIIPDGVEEIADEAFMECSNVTEVVIPSSVKKIGCDVFYRSDAKIVKNGTATE